MGLRCFSPWIFTRKTYKNRYNSEIFHIWLDHLPPNLHGPGWGAIIINPRKLQDKSPNFPNWRSAPLLRTYINVLSKAVFGFSRPSLSRFPKNADVVCNLLFINLVSWGQVLTPSLRLLFCQSDLNWKTYIILEPNLNRLPLTQPCQNSRCQL